MACSADLRLGDGVCVCSMSQGRAGAGAIDATQRRSPRSALGIATTVINSAALLFVPYEDLQAEVDGACRNLRNQAATSEGAKR